MSKAAKTATLTLRMTPRMKHLLDVMSRRQRRTITAIIEWALESASSVEELDIAERTWSTDVQERLLRMLEYCPELITFDEEVEARALLKKGGS